MEKPNHPSKAVSPPKIDLTLNEIQMAADVGIRRRLASIGRRLKDAHGYNPKTPWEDDIQSAAAELAFAKITQSYWPAHINNFKGPDVGEHIQVRFTKLPDGCLIVRDNDTTEDYYVLMTGQIPTFHLAGYLPGHLAKAKRYLRRPNKRPAAYFIPQTDLKPYPMDRE